ncbi:MAG: hypothetical protein RMJ66_06580 [Bacteroidia bacterium]|nr:hypothetical protein [Bacteroidia bacterium]MDW8134717.1 hypothetical protein [Bacteroidia bacterium]
MRDYWGRIWVVALFLGILILSLWLWFQGKNKREAAPIAYLIVEAQKALKCTPYLLNRGVYTDLNQNGALEYLFSCDSDLSALHQRFIWLELRDKKVFPLLHHTEGGWVVGGGKAGKQGVSWLIDRRQKTILILPMSSDSFVEPVEVIWNPKESCLQLAEP